MTTREGGGPMCPYCFSPVADGRLDCTSCQAAHHRMCYSENGGCAVLGCRSDATGPEGRASGSVEHIPSLGSTAPRYRPGDIANGHVLTQNNEWVPVASQLPTAAAALPAPAGALGSSRSLSASAAPTYPASASRGAASAGTMAPGVAHPNGQRPYGSPREPHPASPTAGRRRAAFWVGGLLAALFAVILMASAGGPSGGSSSNAAPPPNSYDSEVSVSVELDSLESCYYADDTWDYEDVEVYDGDGDLLGSDYLTSDGPDSYGDCQYSTYFDVDESSDGIYKIWVGSDYVTRYASDVEGGSLDVSLSAD